jgi:hypothetical protein
MHEDIQVLASSEFKGRYPSTEGDILAQNYISDQLLELNVSALTSRDDLKQPFFVENWAYPISPINVTINGEKLIYNRDYSELKFTGNSTVTVPTEIVFAGYGITTTNFNDYHNQDVSGKIVVVVRGTPDSNMIDYTFGYFGVKARIAFNLGAVGMIVVSNPNSESDNFVRGTITAGNFVANMGSICANRTTIEQLLGIDITSLIENINSDFSTDNSYIGLMSRNTGIFSTFKITTQYKPSAETANILAKFEGAYSGTSERVIIISAHYDHMGISPYGDIYYGADDDASGVAVVLEVARVLNELYKYYKFRKTIIFALWGAEEAGLLGARYFIDNQTVQGFRIEFVVQHDMVGVGFENGSLYVDGGDYITSMFEITHAAENYGNISSVIVTDVGRSDHVPFLQNGINAVNFMWDAPNHPDVHTSNDTADKINPNFLKKIALTTLGFLIEEKGLLGDQINFPTSEFSETTTTLQTSETSISTPLQTSKKSTTATSFPIIMLSIVLLVLTLSRILRRPKNLF